MSKEEQGNQPPSDLVLKFGEALLSEPKLEKIEWDSLGLVLDFREGFIKNYGGFTYLYKSKEYIKMKQTIVTKFGQRFLMVAGRSRQIPMPR